MSMTMALLIGSSLRSLSHKNIQIKKFHNAIKEWTRVSLELGVLSMSSSRLSILKARGLVAL
jgi:hypothetical protein